MHPASPDPAPPRNPNPNPHLPPPSSRVNQPLHFPFAAGGGAAVPAGHHRRARSELAFRFPDDLDLSAGDPAASGAGSLEEIGSEDDLFSAFIDIEKIGGRLDGCGSGSEGGDAGGEFAEARPRHRYSNSIDASAFMGSGGCGGAAGVRQGATLSEVMEAKKAMSSEQLAELAAIDPKRAKRILANRQSAARSKERKARYITELERKVQTLQTEATTLSAQLTLFQRDTTGLSAENAELNMRLQAMEQQAQLRDALNEALKQEVERLRIATGEAAAGVETFNIPLQNNMPFNHSFFPATATATQVQHHGGVQVQQQTPQFHHPHSNVLNYQLLAHPNTIPDVIQQDSVNRLQGLDISKGGQQVVKSESPPISASESSSTF